MATTGKLRIVCAVTRPQGTWRWQKRGALSVYRWNGNAWNFIRYANSSMRYDMACATADFIGRPNATNLMYDAAK